jgi:hypothetical protein
VEPRKKEKEEEEEECENKAVKVFYNDITLHKIS